MGIGVSYLLYGDGTPFIGNVQQASSYSAVQTLETREKCIHDKLQKPFREMLPAEGRAVFQLTRRSKEMAQGDC
jgi:hypothetical protein